MPDNSIYVVGNVGQDPELKFLNNGSAAVKFSVAVSRRWQNQTTKEWEEKTTWLNIVAYGHLAQHAADSFHKGHRVFAGGRIEVRTWDIEGGGKGSTTELIADVLGHDLKFVTSTIKRADHGDNDGNDGGQGGGTSRRAQTQSRGLGSGQEFDDDPF